MKQRGRAGYWSGLFIALWLAAGTGAREANGQVWNWRSLDHLNRKLNGQVLDFTHNHGADRRIDSPALGMKRDLYVYLPPGYNPSVAYPLVLYLHIGYIDEHTFIGLPQLKQLDEMISRGEFPPAIVACPDGMIDGTNRTRAPHSIYLNGVFGRFEDHLMGEVIPFLTRNFSIRPERNAHAILGSSAGGLGGLSIAIRRRDYFGAFAGLAAPSNLRYDSTEGGYRANFDPSTYAWKQTYDPNEVTGVFYFGLRKSRAKRYIEPVFGNDPGVIDRVIAVNPADLIYSTQLKPGELAIYLNYPGRDNWNFDAQAESFAWLAASRGIPVTLQKVPLATHGLLYFMSQHQPAYDWLSGHLLPPSTR